MEAAEAVAALVDVRETEEAVAAEAVAAPVDDRKTEEDSGAQKIVPQPNAYLYLVATHHRRSSY